MTKKQIKHIIIISCISVATAITAFGIAITPVSKDVSGGRVYETKITKQSMDLDIAEENIYNNLPAELVSDFNADGMKVNYVSGIAYKGHSWSAGYYEKGKGIYIDTDDKENTDFSHTTYHEFGHYLDEKLGNISSSAEWKKITADESSDCGTAKGSIDASGKNYYADPKEFFAEECAYHFKGGLSAEDEASKCPEAQSYINNIVNVNFT